MLTLWLADKVLDAVGDDELSYDAITVAQEQIQKGHRVRHEVTEVNPKSWTQHLQFICEEEH